MDTTLKMMNNIIQTFWTLPIQESLLYHYMVMAYASAKSIKNQGYKLTMYTDEKGTKLLNGFPYDEIKVVDMSDVNPSMFAAIKYFALKQEEIGTVHMDFDIIIDKPCIKMTEDALVQDKTYSVINSPNYYNVYGFFEECGYPSNITYDLIYEIPYCVGVIGFNNEKLKQQFLSNYFEAVELYKDIKEIPIVDLVLEQQYLSRLAAKNNYKVDVISNNITFVQVGSNRSRYQQDKNVGYTHYIRNSKFTDEAQKNFHKYLEKEDIKIINNNYLNYLYN